MGRRIGLRNGGKEGRRKGGKTGAAVGMCGVESARRRRAAPAGGHNGRQNGRNERGRCRHKVHKAGGAVVVVMPVPRRSRALGKFKGR